MAHDPYGVNHEQYVRERMLKDPDFSAAFGEAQAELAMAFAIADLRERRGLSQRQLAAMAGMAQPALARLERGAHLPSFSTLIRLLKALNVEAVLRPDGEVLLQEVLPASSRPFMVPEALSA